MKTNIELHDVFGEEGFTLFAVINVDTEDAEMTQVRIFRANDEEHLRKQLLDEYVGEEDEEDMIEMATQMYEDAIDSTLLIQEIGRILV